MNKCDNCGSVHSSQWHDDHKMVEDEYGIACSEPGVPTHISIPIKICDDCMQEFVYFIEEGYETEYSEKYI